MRTRLSGGLAAAALAMAGVASAPTAVPVSAPAQQGVTAQQAQARQDQAPTPAPQVTALELAALGFGRLPARLRHREPVWIGHPRSRNDVRYLLSKFRGRGANGGRSELR